MTDEDRSDDPTNPVRARLDVQALAQEIRRVDGEHALGAGALAQELMPFIERALGVVIPPAPPECETEGELTAYAFGYWKGLRAAATSCATGAPFARGSWQHAVDDHLVGYARTSQEFATPHEAVQWLLQQTADAAIACGMPGASATAHLSTYEDAVSTGNEGVTAAQVPRFQRYTSDHKPSDHGQWVKWEDVAPVLAEARDVLASGVAGRPAHSRSEYKRRTALGDPNVLPPAAGVALPACCRHQDWCAANGQCPGGNCDARGVTASDGGQR